MNSRQKEIQNVYLQNEKEVLEALKKNYESVLDDIQEKIARLQADEMLQSKVYQIEYQKMLEAQISAYIDILNGDNYSTINEYLQKCYEDGFIGTMYDLQGQGISLTLPISQEEVIASITKSVDDIKLSERLYGSTEQLKKSIIAETSRGIANGYSYLQIGNNLAGYIKANTYQAFRIARTEGHRITQEATFAAQQAAKDKGADVVKQWSAAMDTRTRENHIRLDGQVKELEEEFELDGKKAMYPGGFGLPEEDINCRCCLLQRARWALTDEELASLVQEKEFASIGGSSYNQFKSNYNQHIVHSKDFQALETHLKDKYNVTLDPAVTKLDFDAVKEAIWGVERVLDDFVGLDQYLNKFSVTNSGIMACDLSGTILFNSQLFSDYSYVLSEISDVVEMGSTHRNTWLSSIGIHETGHLIEAALLSRENLSQSEKIDSWNDGTHAKGIVLEAYNSMDTSVTLNTAIGEISEYAMEDWLETIAEGIADYYTNGTNASPLSKSIYGVLKGRF